MSQEKTPPAGAQALAELADTIERCRKEPSITGLIAIEPDEADLIVSSLRALADMRAMMASGIPFSHSDRPDEYDGLVELMFRSSGEARAFAEAVMAARQALARSTP